jgi:hypothetical protein
LTSTLVPGEWSASRPGRFNPGKEPRYPLYKRLCGPQSPSGRLEKSKFLTLPGIELRLLGRPAHSQSLYRLRYPGSESHLVCFTNVIFTITFYVKLKGEDIKFILANVDS